MQPGGIISPGTPSSDAPDSKDDEHADMAPQTQDMTDELTESASEKLSEESDAKDSGWKFSAEEDDSNASVEPPTLPSNKVSWTASEYVAHDKSAGWYMLVVFSAIVLAALILLITEDKVSSIVVVVLGVAFAAFGARKPQVLEYSIDNKGVHIGNRTYAFGMFRTFSVIEEDAIRSILLMPLQRFNLPIAVYYDPNDENKIIEALSDHIPHAERRIGPIDNFMRKIRF